VLGPSIDSATLGSRRMFRTFFHIREIVNV